MKEAVVYIMASKRNGTIYTGVTSNVVQRIYQNKNDIIQGFCSKYNCKLLVYLEAHESIEDAILREKQIKLYNRKKKLKLIEGMNPQWNDLYLEITSGSWRSAKRPPSG